MTYREAVAEQTAAEILDRWTPIPVEHHRTPPRRVASRVVNFVDQQVGAQRAEVRQ